MGRLALPLGLRSGLPLLDASSFGRGSSYAISVGTLSEVMPLPPGHVLIMSRSSGAPLYAAATPEYYALVSRRSFVVREMMWTCSRSKIDANHYPILCWWHVALVTVDLLARTIALAIHSRNATPATRRVVNSHCPSICESSPPKATLRGVERDLSSLFAQNNVDAQALRNNDRLK